MLVDRNVWRHRSARLIITLGGFALRLYRLGADSLWYDETVSAYLASKRIPDLIAHTARDIHPPGYYLLLHLWTRLVGDSEFALAFLSLIFGVLLIPLTYALARRLLGRTPALWSALLVATSPYNLWYSQEVRMYTLGAALGLVALWFAMEWLKPSPRQRLLHLIGYILSSALGLYALYYFAFLLVALNLVVIGCLLLSRRFSNLRTWLLAQAGALLLYLPWTPIAWRQATNPPVPPWRSLIPPQTAALQSWTALSLGQSVRPNQVWPILAVTGLLLLLGLRESGLRKSGIGESGSKSPESRFLIPRFLKPSALLATYTFGPLILIYLVSLITPLYHVRYLFTYSPPFYILLGGGLAWLGQRARILGILAALTLLGGSAFSICELHTNPRYASDDFRAAANFIAERWRPGDAVLINAGYAYTGFMTYYEAPIAGRIRLSQFQPTDDLAATSSDYPLLLLAGSIGGDSTLGWGDPQSDFYATSQAETAAALTRVTQTFPRLWVLRIYDTVTDPQGFIRDWLATNTMPFEDQVFAGEANMRVQGFMSITQPNPPQETKVPLEGNITLLGWQAEQTVGSGDALDAVLWWQADAPLATDYAVSLKLWDSQGQETSLVTQQDEWPVGSLLFTSDWPPGRPIRHPMRLWLPAELAPGQYWLNVEMYHPDTIQPLPRRDGQEQSISLGAITVTSPQ